MTPWDCDLRAGLTTLPSSFPVPFTASGGAPTGWTANSPSTGILDQNTTGVDYYSLVPSSLATVTWEVEVQCLANAGGIFHTYFVIGDSSVSAQVSLFPTGMTWYTNGGGVTVASFSGDFINTWRRIRLVKNGAAYSVFVDSVQVGATTTATASPDARMYFGQGSAGTGHMRIRSMRWSTGGAFVMGSGPDPSFYGGIGF